MRYVDLIAGTLGLLGALRPLLGQLQFSLAAPASPAMITRLLLLLLLAAPWLAVLAGMILGLRDKGTAPLLVGVGGLAAALLGPARADLLWPVLLLGLSAALRLRRSPLHPMGMLGTFTFGLVLAALGYIILILLSVSLPRG